MTKFNPEKVFPKESVVGRELIKAYEANPIIKIPIPSKSPIAFLPKEELPYQWKTVYPNTIITSDCSELLRLNLQVPIIIDKDDRITLFKALENAGFDGKVRGSYVVSLNSAIEGKYIEPNKGFSFSSAENPSLHLEYPENIDGTKENTMGIDVELKSKENEGVHIDEKDFRFVDAIYDFAKKRKNELSTEYIDKWVKAKTSTIGLLTVFADKLAEFMFIGKYVPKELKSENIEKSKEELISFAKSFKSQDYKATLKKESRMSGLMVSKDEDVSIVAAKLFKVAAERKPSSNEEKGLLEAIEYLSWEKEMKEFF